jgi:DNA-binding XRE family transcriptional regulator
MASENFSYLSARHFRAARVLLSWSQGELAIRARVVRRTIVMLESGGRRTHPRNIRAVVEVFLAAGVRFALSSENEISIIDATDSRISIPGNGIGAPPAPQRRLAHARVSGRRRSAE